MTLTKAQEGKLYNISKISTNDEELESFLFSLGLYSGEPLCVVSHLKNGCIITIKNARYHIDKHLAEAITV